MIQSTGGRNTPSAVHLNERAAKILPIHAPTSCHSKTNAGEILSKYRKTRFAERLYNMKIGVAWADVSKRLTAAEAHCGDHGLLEDSTEHCTMGVDTGKELHVVVSRWISGRQGEKREVVWIGTRQSFAELDELMGRYNIARCVIDAMPELHAAREFANRHRERVYINFFLESQSGKYAWDHTERIVRENRTEALDASRKAVRDGKVVFPRSGRLMQEFADAKAGFGCVYGERFGLCGAGFPYRAPASSTN